MLFGSPTIYSPIVCSLAPRQSYRVITQSPVVILRDIGELYLYPITAKHSIARVCAYFMGYIAQINCITTASLGKCSEYLISFNPAACVHQLTRGTIPNKDKVPYLIVYEHHLSKANTGNLDMSDQYMIYNGRNSLVSFFEQKFIRRNTRKHKSIEVVFVLISQNKKHSFHNSISS